MKTIAFCARKGGTGKSTLAIQMGGALVSAGHVVVIVDLDVQGSVGQWAAHRPEDALPMVVTSTADKVGEIAAVLRQRQVAWCLLDTPSVVDEPAQVAAHLADLVVVPARPTALDLNALGHTLRLTRATAPQTVVLNQVNAHTRELAEVRTTLAGVPQLCPHVVRDRVAFRRAYEHMHTVYEGRYDRRARQDIQQLTDWITQEIS